MRALPLVLLLCSAAPASATVLDFTQPGALALVPGSGLTLAGLSLTGDPLPVATSPGVGLGLHDGLVTRGLVYSGTGAIAGTNGFLDLQVAGIFTRLILQPFFTVIGGPPADATQVIELSIGSGAYVWDPAELMIDAARPYSIEPNPRAGLDHLQLGLRTDFGPDPWLSQYIQANGRPQAIAWGFAVQSVSWEPTPVSTPEPAGLGLVGLGLVLCRRWRIG